MRRATPISLTDDARRQLEQLKRSRTVSVRLAQRAAIVLLAAGGLENQRIAQVMSVSRQKVARWRDWYAERGLAGIEKDAPRPGRKRRIDDKQRAAIVRKTLRQTPEGHTHWSRSTMAVIVLLGRPRSATRFLTLVGPDSVIKATRSSSRPESPVDDSMSTPRSRSRSVIRTSSSNIAGSRLAFESGLLRREGSALCRAWVCCWAEERVSCR